MTKLDKVVRLLKYLLHQEQFQSYQDFEDHEYLEVEVSAWQKGSFDDESRSHNDFGQFRLKSGTQRF